MTRQRLLIDDTQRGAVFSPCKRYRYSLTRQWSRAATINFIMLNPSTADELLNDPTVERCERRARRNGYGCLIVTNIFAWRSTDPKALLKVEDPVGPENDRWLIHNVRQADVVVCAWGVHKGRLQQRAMRVRQLLGGLNVPLFALRTSDGEPHHPLYVPYEQGLQPYCREERGVLI